MDKTESDVITREPQKRSSVREFFKMSLDDSPIKKRPPAWTWILGAFGVFAAVVGAYSYDLAGAIIAGVIGLALVSAVDRWLATRAVKAVRANRYDERRKFESLAEETRRIQGSDVRNAFLREFQRTQIDRSELRILNEVFMANTELGFFDEETDEQKFGDLMNKSIIFTSRGVSEDDGGYLRPIRWGASGRFELFYNPIRLIILFITETELVICDAKIDSITGDLEERIHRSTLPEIVSITFEGKRHHTPLTMAEAIQSGRDQGYSDEELNGIRESFDERKGGEGPAWFREESVALLHVTRTDGEGLTFPIQTTATLGQNRGALDTPSVNEEEVRVDRIVNELNRLVHTSKI